MIAQLKTIPFLEPYPSHANFVLAKVWLCGLTCALCGDATKSSPAKHALLFFPDRLSSVHAHVF